MKEAWKSEEQKYPVKCRGCEGTLLIPLDVLASGSQMICSNCKNIIYIEKGSFFAAKEMSKRLKKNKV